jgi:hypothetical protein
MSVKISPRSYPPVSFLHPGRISQNSGWGSRSANAHIGRTQAWQTEAKNGGVGELTSRKRKRRRKRFRQRRSFVGRGRCRWWMRSVPQLSVPDRKTKFYPRPVKSRPRVQFLPRRSVKEGSWQEYVQASCDFEAECTVCGWRLVFVNCLVGVDGLLPGKVVQMFHDSGSGV